MDWFVVQHDLPLQQAEIGDTIVVNRAITDFDLRIFDYRIRIYR